MAGVPQAQPQPRRRRGAGWLWATIVVGLGYAVINTPAFQEGYREGTTGGSRIGLSPTQTLYTPAPANPPAASSAAQDEENLRRQVAMEAENARRALEEAAREAAEAERAAADRLARGLKVEGRPRFLVGEYSSRIEGKVVNRTGRDLTYAEVEFAIYDKGGSQVGTAMDNITHLGAGATWKFSAIVTEDAAASARLVNVEGR